MRLSIFRRFSRLVHRRTRSEPFAPTTAILDSPLDSLTRPKSLDLFHEQRVVSTLDSVLSPNVLGSPGPQSLDSGAHLPLGPSLLSSGPKDSSSSARSSLDKAQPNHVKSEYHSNQVQVTRRLSQMEAENLKLKATVESLQFEAELREERIGVIQCGLSTDHSIAMRAKRKVLQVDELPQSERSKLERYERYFDFLMEIGLDELLALDAKASLDSGIDADTVIINGFLELTRNPQSKFQCILPAIIGQRTQPQYFSAIRQLLLWRRRCKDNGRMAKFWRNIARKDGANADIITPSPSDVSMEQDISKEREDAATELLEKLRSGKLPLRSCIVPQFAADCHEKQGDLPDLLSIMKLDEEKALDMSQNPPDKAPSEEITVLLQHSSSKEPSLLPYLHSASSIPRSEPSTHTIPLSHGADPPQVRLPPLASQVFKEELIASHSIERFSVSNSYMQIKPLLRGLAGEKETQKECRHSACQSNTSIECLPSISNSSFSFGRDAVNMLSTTMHGRPEGSALHSVIGDELDDLVNTTCSTIQPLVTIEEEFSPGSVTTSEDTDFEPRHGNHVNSNGSGDGDITLVEDSLECLSQTDNVGLSLESPVKRSFLPVLSKLPRRSNKLSSPKSPKQAPLVTTRSLNRPTISSSLKQQNQSPSKAAEIPNPRLNTSRRVQQGIKAEITTPRNYRETAGKVLRRLSRLG